MNLPWFRMYTEFATDPVVQMLAFEDQRHFVVLLCLKGSGLLDREFPNSERRNQVICAALGLDPVAGAEAKRRLMDDGLIGSDWQPANWAKRQFTTDHDGAERTRRWRERKVTSRDVTVTTAKRHSDGLDTDTDTEQKGERGAVAPTPPKKASKTCPETWEPSPWLLGKIRAEEVEGCLARGGTTVAMELERFRSCTFGTARSDWDKTAWNWLLTECKKINQKEVMYGANRQAQRR